jgi:hypothetical protein
LKARKYIDFLINDGIKWVTDTSIGKTVKNLSQKMLVYHLIWMI